MKLEKQLISFYQQSKIYEITLAESKELKRSAKRLPKAKTYNIALIQEAVDHQIWTEKCSARLERIGKELFERRIKITRVLSAIGLPARVTISVAYEQVGNIDFWYENMDLHFKEMEQ